MNMGHEDDTRLSEEIKQLKEGLIKRDREIEGLKISNLFLGTLFDGISEEIMVLDPEFNVTDVNRAFLKRYGLKKSDVLGEKCYEIKKRARAPCSFEDISCPLTLAKEAGQRVEMSLFHEDAKGEKKELALYMYPLRLRGKRIKYFMEVARDVTENRALMRQLQVSEKRFKAILDTATDAVLSIDENHKIVLFNNAAQRIFGYSRQEVLGKDLNILIPPKYGDHQSYVRGFLERRESDIIGKTISLTGLRKGSQEFPIELSLSFLEMDGEITFTAIIRDVSDQKKLEKKLLQSERLAAVGQAAAHVAHELKNPLTIIGGFSAQIKKRLENVRDLQKLDMIFEEVKRLEKLVANLGDFTKEYRLVKRPADINLVIKDILKIMAGAHSLEKYYFKKSLSSDVAEINCDPDKLKQVFINIISNGLEAMAEGGSITVSTERIPGGIEVKINDEGMGIPEEDLQQIFEPFYTTRKGGSGLGLSISFKIVEAHGGEISTISRPGEGATFIIRLPSE
jgi:two-component system sensor kinase FixL